MKIHHLKSKIRRRSSVLSWLKCFWSYAHRGLVNKYTFCLCLQCIGIDKIAGEFTWKLDYRKSSKMVQKSSMVQKGAKWRSPNTYNYEVKWLIVLKVMFFYVSFVYIFRVILLFVTVGFVVFLYVTCLKQNGAHWQSLLISAGYYSVLVIAAFCLLRRTSIFDDIWFFFTNRFWLKSPCYLMNSMEFEKENYICVFHQISVSVAPFAF